MNSLQSLVNSDWSPSNLLTLARVIRNAYARVDAVCDPLRTEFFGTRNAIHAIGYNRWIAVDYYLKQACDRGDLPGISAEWVSLGGRSGNPIHAVELRGAHTCVQAVHVSSPDVSPRDSRYRYDMRACNEKNPLLIGFIEPSEHEIAMPELLNLLLVHGDKRAEFAMLRAYDDADNKASFTAFSGNLMDNTVHVDVFDSETVPEPIVALLPQVAQQDASSGA